MAKIALGSLKGPKGDAGDVTPEALAAKSAAEAARTAAVTAANTATQKAAQAEAAAASVPTEEQLAATFVTFKNFDGTPVLGSNVVITLSQDGTDIQDITVEAL